MKKDSGRLWWLIAEQNNGTELLFSYLEPFHSQCLYNTVLWQREERPLICTIACTCKHLKLTYDTVLENKDGLLQWWGSLLPWLVIGTGEGCTWSGLWIHFWMCLLKLVSLLTVHYSLNLVMKTRKSEMIVILQTPWSVFFQARILTFW